MDIKNKLTTGYEKLRLYWTKPPHGRYMPYKEIVSLSVGGMGVKFIVFCVNNMILSVGNTLIGNTIGIDPKSLYIIYLLSIVASFPLTTLRAKMIDNTRSKKGKYRPYIVSMGIPTVVLGIAFIWTPYENMTSLQQCAAVLLYNIGFQFFYNFMNDAYDSIINVLSPNTIERSDVYSVKAVVENFSPSIAQIFLPIAARLITGENTLYDIRVYRALYPPMMLVGLLLSILVYVNTEERIVQAKTHVVQIKVSDAFRAVARNKYFWIISLAGWLGFLENSFDTILGWLYNYQKVCSDVQYSLITAIYGNASFWPNLVAPVFVRKYGKRNILLISNLMSVGFILLMYPAMRYTNSAYMIWVLLIFFFINRFITALGHNLGPSINADIRDYQQYITGERIDGMFAAVGLIGSVITMATSYVLPAIYERAGLNETVALSLGYNGSNVYDVLFHTGYFMDISRVLIYASAVGALLNVIPFFFYDLTETRQKAMVTVLKIRALFEDYGNNALSDEKLVEAIDIINEANEYVDKPSHTLTKDGIKAARQGRDKAAVKAAKTDYRRQREENEKIEIAQYVHKEITRFDSAEGIAELQTAQQMVAAGLQGFTAVQQLTVAQAKTLPKNTVAKKEQRSAAIDRARKMVAARKAIAKYYPQGLTEFDQRIFDKLFAAEDKNEAELHAAILALKAAREEKDRAQIRTEKEAVAALQKQRAQIKQEIKKATNQNSIYNRAAKPYLDAQKLLIQRENYTHYEEIAARYEESRARNAAQQAAQQAKEEEERLAKEAYAAKLKAEKELEKAKKKNGKK